MAYRKDFFISKTASGLVITKNAESRLLTFEEMSDPKKRYLYKKGDKILTPFGVETIMDINYHYGSLDSGHGYEWLITVEENGNQYKPIELIGIVLPMTLNNSELNNLLKLFLGNR